MSRLRLPDDYEQRGSGIKNGGPAKHFLRCPIKNCATRVNDRAEVYTCLNDSEAPLPKRVLNGESLSIV